MDNEGVTSSIPYPQRALAAIGAVPHARQRDSACAMPSESQMIYLDFLKIQ
jgi:hypothetical protein